VQSVVLITIGTLDASLVHRREVFKPVILEGASSVIVSHNHPSGDVTPSRGDREVTARLKAAGQILGIEIRDHIIYGDGTSDLRSMSESEE
jgi:DNA repair protein RadC